MPKNPATARRYALGTAGSNIFTRFPDQFAPFLSLRPKLAQLMTNSTQFKRAGAGGGGGGSGGGGRSSGTINNNPDVATVFRLPFRTVASDISPCIPQLSAVRSAITLSEVNLRSSLLFTTSLGSISLNHWLSGNNTQLESVFKAQLKHGPSLSPSNVTTNNSSNSSSFKGSNLNDPRTRRRLMLDCRESLTKRGILNIFSKYTPPRDAYTARIDIEYRERIPVAAVSSDNMSNSTTATATTAAEVSLATSMDVGDDSNMVVASAVMYADNDEDEFYEATATATEDTVTDTIIEAQVDVEDAEVEVDVEDTEVEDEGNNYKDDDMPISMPASSTSSLASGSIVNCSDIWLIRCSIAPTSEIRDLALQESLKPLDLLQLLSVAGMVSSTEVRSTDNTSNEGTSSSSSTSSSSNESITSYRTPSGSIFVGVDSMIPTGLPFHIDGPFFIKDVDSQHALYVSPHTSQFADRELKGDDSDDDNNDDDDGNDPYARKIAEDNASRNGRNGNQGGSGSGGSGGGGGGNRVSDADLIRGRWNELLLEGAMLELVPDFMVDLRDCLSGRFHQEASSLYVQI